MYRIWIIVLALVMSFVLNFHSGLTFAQEQASPSTSVQEVQTNRLTGQIVKVEDSSLTVNTTEGVKEVTVPNNINISKNGNAVSKTELKPGDGVIITQSSNGEILSIDALSGSALDVRKWVFPIGLGVLVLGVLIFLAWARMRKEYIKTS